MDVVDDFTCSVELLTDKLTFQNEKNKTRYTNGSGNIVERERERENQTERERETERETNRQTERQRQTESVSVSMVASKSKFYYKKYLKGCLWKQRTKIGNPVLLLKSLHMQLCSLQGCIRPQHRLKPYSIFKVTGNQSKLKDPKDNEKYILHFDEVQVDICGRHTTHFTSCTLRKHAYSNI